MSGLASRLDGAMALGAPLLLAALVGLLSAIGIAWRRAQRAPSAAADRGLLALVAAAIAVFALALGSLELMTWTARAQAERALAAPVAEVLVDGARAAQPERLVMALRRLHDGHPDHSQPLKPHEVIVKTASGQIRLVLRQDSKAPENYWVFYPAWRATRLNPIGHVTVPPR